MANKTIDELASASSINDNDLFVLQQSNVAKKLLGSVLKQYVTDIISTTCYTKAQVDTLLLGKQDVTE